LPFGSPGDSQETSAASGASPQATWRKVKRCEKHVLNLLLACFDVMLRCPFEVILSLFVVYHSHGVTYKFPPLRQWELLPRVLKARVLVRWKHHPSHKANIIRKLGIVKQSNWHTKTTHRFWSKVEENEYSTYTKKFQLCDTNLESLHQLLIHKKGFKKGSDYPIRLWLIQKSSPSLASILRDLVHLNSCQLVSECLRWLVV